MSAARRVLLQACVVAAGLAVPSAVLARAASEPLSLQGYGMAGLMTFSAADSFDAVLDTHNGFHLAGGADVRLGRWIAVAGDVTWASIGDAIGDGGVSAAFQEDDLGGTSVRFRIIIGR